MMIFPSLIGGCRPVDADDPLDQLLKASISSYSEVLVLLLSQ